jgi:hypothetical protein
MPTFLAGKFDRGDRLSSEQRRDILICRLALLTGWPLDYIESLPLEWVGKLLSYDDGISLLRRLS